MVLQWKNHTRVCWMKTMPYFFSPFHTFTIHYHPLFLSFGAQNPWKYPCYLQIWWTLFFLINCLEAFDFFFFSLFFSVRDLNKEMFHPGLTVLYVHPTLASDSGFDLLVRVDMWPPPSSVWWMRTYQEGAVLMRTGWTSKNTTRMKAGPPPRQTVWTGYTCSSRPAAVENLGPVSDRGCTGSMLVKFR